MAALKLTGLLRLSNVFTLLKAHFGPGGTKKMRRRRIWRRATNLGPGVFAGQISNFDQNDVEFFPLPVPDIPLTPEGTDYKPSKLLMVWRIKRLNGRPYWEKDIMKTLGLEDPAYNIQILKNTPSSNQMLYHVKHLIRVKPITFPDGIPTAADIGNTILKPNGELIIRKELEVDPLQLEQEPVDDVKRLDGNTISKHLHLRWGHAYDT